MLAGIVVNNTIVLVETIELKKEQAKNVVVEQEKLLEEVKEEARQVISLCPGPPNLSVHRPDHYILNRWPLLYP